MGLHTIAERPRTPQSTKLNIRLSQDNIQLSLKFQIAAQKVGKLLEALLKSISKP